MIIKLPIWKEELKKDGKYIWDIGPDIERFKLLKRNHRLSKKRSSGIEDDDGGPAGMVLTHCVESLLWEACIPFCRLIGMLKWSTQILTEMEESEIKPTEKFPQIPLLIPQTGIVGLHTDEIVLYISKG